MNVKFQVFFHDYFFQLNKVEICTDINHWVLFSFNFLLKLKQDNKQCVWGIGSGIIPIKFLDKIRII